jgi:heme exporter protein D
MNWGGVNEFLAMGGYGLYVWGSYAVTALCLAVEIWILRKS